MPKKPRARKGLFHLTGSLHCEGVMAGTPGKKPEIETEAEAMAEWCLLACSQVRSVWSLVLGPSYINQENAVHICLQGI